MRSDKWKVSGESLMKQDKQQSQGPRFKATTLLNRLVQIVSLHLEVVAWILVIMITRNPKAAPRYCNWSCLLA